MISLAARLRLAALAIVCGAGVVVWGVADLHQGGGGRSRAVPPAPPAAPAAAPPPTARMATPRVGDGAAGAAGVVAPPAAPLAVLPPAQAGGCMAVAYTADAVANALSLADAQTAAGVAAWAPYAPLTAREIGSACPADSSGFARALAAWRAAHGLEPAGGTMDAATLQALQAVWNLRRPFVRASAGHVCPPAASEAALATAAPGEGYGGKAVRLLPGALASWRRMVADARAQVPAIAADPRLLSLVSGWRGPAEEQARCADGSCDGRAKSSCSAHRTGAAMDLYLGGGLTATEPARAALARSPAYLWLVANADRYGLVPYAFEPWHWEWTGGA